MEKDRRIDVQELAITPQDADNTYIGINENGQLVRTKIELNDDIDERIAQEIYDEVKSNKIAFISGNKRVGFNWGDYLAEVYYATINDETILTEWGEKKNFELETKANANTKYGKLEDDLNVQKGSIQSFQNELDEFKRNKITIGSGNNYDSAYYGNTLECEIKTINGESLIGDNDIKLETKDDANTKYEKLENDISKQNSNIQSFQNEIDDFKNTKISIRSGYDYASAYYGNTLDCRLKTINGETLIGDGDITITGGSGGGIEPYIFNIIDTQWEETPDWDALKAVFDSGKPMIMRYITDEGDVNICQVLGWNDRQFWAVGRWAGLIEDGINMYYGYPERVYCYSKIVLEAELDVELYKITSQIGDINNILESI